MKLNILHIFYNYKFIQGGVEFDSAIKKYGVYLISYEVDSSLKQL